MWNIDQAGGYLCAQVDSGITSIVYMVATNKCNSAFHFPTAGPGQISLNGTKLCLQQDNAADPDLVLATCGLAPDRGGAAETWIPHLIPASNYPATYSFQNSDTKYCLNDDYYLDEMTATDCNGGADEIWEFPGLGVTVG